MCAALRWPHTRAPGASCSCHVALHAALPDADHAYVARCSGSHRWRQVGGSRASQLCPFLLFAVFAPVHRVLVAVLARWTLRPAQLWLSPS